MKRALITGVTGQDGSYLAELLLSKGYEVHGIKRRASSYNTSRVDHLPALKLHYGDMTDGSSLSRIVSAVDPHEVYNLAAQSHVQVSFETPEYTANSDALGTMRLLEAVKAQYEKGHTPTFYQASTSELYGNSGGYLRNEQTPFMPRSPYAAAKLYAYWITVNYREAYGIHASNGILFNHESPRRGPTFVTRKITKAVAAIAAGKRTASTSATSTPSGIGATPRTTSRRCGSRSSKTNPMTTSSRPAKRIPCASSSNSPLTRSAWTSRGAAAARSRPGTTGRPGKRSS